MGDHITYRERTNDRLAPVTARKGWISVANDPINGTADPADGSVECGAGTIYPMEVTLAQFDEIAYRVRESKFTAGSFTLKDPVFFDFEAVRFVFGSSTVGVNLAESATGQLSIRGQCSMAQYWEDGDPTPVPMPQVDQTPFSAIYTIPSLYSGFGGNTDTLYVRDVISELGLYSNASQNLPLDTGYYRQLIDYTLSNVEINEYIRGGTGYYGHETGMDHFCADEGYSGGSLNGFWIEFFSPTPPEDPVILSQTTYLNFGKSLVFLDITGSGEPFDIGNKLYMYVDMLAEFESTIYSGDTARINSFKDVGSVFLCNVKLNLSGIGNQVSFPIYLDPWAVDLTDWLVSGVTDIELTAIKWWEYADNAGDPAWDSTTGLPANGGPGG